VFVNDPTNSKALWHAGKAHFGLRQFHQALEYFSKLSQVCNNDGDYEAEEEWKNCVERCEESTKGPDVNRIYLSNVEKRPIEIGDFRHPGLAVEHAVGKRCGFVAYEDIQPGTLLFVEKPICSSKPRSDDRFTCRCPTKFNPVCCNLNSRCAADLLQMVRRNPKTHGAIVCNLICGIPKMKNTVGFCNLKERTDPQLDLEWFRGITQHNGLMTWDQDEHEAVVFPSAYLLTPSCVPNAVWTIMNGYIVVHAVKTVESGQNVTISHRSVENRPFTMEESERLSFMCQCYLCGLDQAETAQTLIKRREVFGKIYTLAAGFHRSERTNPETARMPTDYHKLVSELEKTYEISCRTELRTMLFEPYYEQARLLLSAEKLDSALSLLKMAIACFGVIYDEMVVATGTGDRMIFPKKAVPQYRILSAMSVMAEVMLKMTPIPIVHLKAHVTAIEVLERIMYGINRQTVITKYPEIPGEYFEDAS